MVDNIETAEKCVKFLRDNNVGVATFIAMDKVRARMWKCPGQAVKSTEFKLWCFRSSERGLESPAVTLVS